MSHPSTRRLRTALIAIPVAAVLGVATLPATSSAASSAAPAPAPAVQPPALGVASEATAGGVTLENSFVSSVGWVKPDAGTPAQDGKYPSRVILTNPTVTPQPAQVAVAAPAGTTILSVSGPGTSAVTGGGTGATWTAVVPAGTATAPGRVTLVLEQQADTLAETPTLVWRDLSTTATLTVGVDSSDPAYSHGPKVIPPSEVYDTARYGDRPFPVVPVQYTDRPYQATHTGDSLEGVINDPGNEGSTFNLFQEMSLGQLYPEGTVPSAGIGTADFGSYAPGFDFTERAVPGNTCLGSTLAGTELLPTPPPYDTPLLYPERITDGVYNLPGNTGYYGSDSNGSAVIGSLAGVGALQNIDSGCGDTGKLVYDAAAIADPEIDYSDYDTDKDGVVDFFMVVFAGCGGNGSSQLSVAGCAYPDAPYDNVWPHSSSLLNGYTDPVTGLPGFTTDDQLKDLEGRPLWYTDTSYTDTTTVAGPDALKVFVRVGPYNVNPETAIDFASVISHEYGHSLGLPDFYSTGSRTTYGAWNLMAEDRSQNMDAFSRQELGWVVPEVLSSSHAETGITDSREDTDSITWQRPDGTAYELEEGVAGVQRVQNSQMYVAKLPGRQLLDPAAFDTGATATKSHLWWSGSGNDFGCSPSAGRNFDLAVPGLADLPDDSTVELSFKSYWDIEWDFDYGYVLTTKNGGQSYTSHPSEEGYTTSNTDPLAGNPNTNGCQTTYDNGLTGTSGSYADGTEATDRKLGNTPAPVFLEDRYDISDLAGEANAAVRFSYATDPGLARPGWFVDDVVVTATTPGGDQLLLDTDFETTGGPSDPRVFNGGCKEDLSTARKCTLGWRYLQAGASSEQDHAYYLELRDRSGFDLDGNGQADRGEASFEPGLYLSYTDDAHGYGNAGTDDPPAQSPLDSVPVAGSATPDLDDAAFTTAAGRSAYSDSGAGHVDNYADPSSASGNWEFKYGCLGFAVDSMSGQTEGPEEADGDLTGAVSFTMGSGCGAFNYGYGPTAPAEDNTAPTAKASATPANATVGQDVVLSADGSTDAQTPDNLTYSWDFGDGGSTKDATGKNVTHKFTATGSYQPKVTVSDAGGLTATATTAVTVTGGPGSGSGSGSALVAKIKLRTKHPSADRKVRLVAKLSTGTGALTYTWNFHNGGKKVDAKGVKVSSFFRRVGQHRITLTVTDSTGASAQVTRSFRVRPHHPSRALRISPLF